MKLRGLFIGAVITTAIASPLWSDQVTMRPRLEPFVDQLVNFDCSFQSAGSPSVEQVEKYRLELRQVSEAFFMNYRDLSFRPVVKMSVDLFNSEDVSLIDTFEVEGERVGENRAVFESSNSQFEFRISLRGLPVGAGTISTRNFAPFGIEGLYLNSVDCFMSIQE